MTNQLNTLIPVGTAMIMVVAVKYARVVYIYSHCVYVMGSHDEAEEANSYYCIDYS